MVTEKDRVGYKIFPHLYRRAWPTHFKSTTKALGICFSFSDPRTLISHLTSDLFNSDNQRTGSWGWGCSSECHLAPSGFVLAMETEQREAVAPTKASAFQKLAPRTAASPVGALAQCSCPQQAPSQQCREMPRDSSCR